MTKEELAPIILSIIVFAPFVLMIIYMLIKDYQSYKRQKEINRSFAKRFNEFNDWWSTCEKEYIIKPSQLPRQK